MVTVVVAAAVEGGGLRIVEGEVARKVQRVEVQVGMVVGGTALQAHMGINIVMAAVIRMVCQPPPLSPAQFPCTTPHHIPTTTAKQDRTAALEFSSEIWGSTSSHHRFAASGECP